MGRLSAVSADSLASDAVRLRLQSLHQFLRQSFPVDRCPALGPGDADSGHLQPKHMGVCVCVVVFLGREETPRPASFANHEKRGTNSKKPTQPHRLFSRDASQPHKVPSVSTPGPKCVVPEGCRGGSQVSPLNSQLFKVNMFFDLLQLGVKVPRR